MASYMLNNSLVLMVFEVVCYGPPTPLSCMLGKLTQAGNWWDQEGMTTQLGESDLRYITERKN